MIESYSEILEEKKVNFLPEGRRKIFNGKLFSTAYIFRLDEKSRQEAIFWWSRKSKFFSFFSMRVG